MKLPLPTHQTFSDRNDVYYVRLSSGHATMFMPRWMARIIARDLGGIVYKIGEEECACAGRCNYQAGEMECADERSAGTMLTKAVIAIGVPLLILLISLVIPN